MAIDTIVWEAGRQNDTNGRQIIHMSDIEYNCLKNHTNGRQTIQMADKQNKCQTNDTNSRQTTQMTDKRNLNPANKKNVQSLEARGYAYSRLKMTKRSG